LEKAISVATDEQDEKTKQAKAATRKRANDTVAWFTEKFGLEAKWVRSDTDTEYVRKRDTFGYQSWTTEAHFRHRIKVDDVMLGLSYGRYGADTNPSIDVMYVTCPECGNEHGVDVGYVSTHGGIDKAQASLVSRIGHVATGKHACSRCQARPCGECGRPH